MRITDVKNFIVWGGGRNFHFVKVETDEWVSGLGEAGRAWREKVVAEVVEHLKPFLIGADAGRIEHLWQVMFRGGFFPAGRIGCAAISAIDVALWDIKGKALGVPVYDLLGGRVRDRVVCYPHNAGHATELTPLLESCLRTRAEGWKFVRWRLQTDGQARERRGAVRQ